MTKNQFIQLLHHYSDSNPEQANGILELKSKYPYSQVLHALAARLTQDNGTSGHQKELQLAAVYASDRTVLKSVMTRTTDPWPVSHELEGQKHEHQPVTRVAQPVLAAGAATAEQAPEEDLADEVQHDLERLSELRHNFEMMFVDAQDAPATPAKSETHVTKEESLPVEEQPKKRPLPPGRKPGRSKAQKIVELAKQLEQKEAEEAEPAPDDAEGIIEEIKNSKKKVSPASERQKEQIGLIDNFIKARPNIPNPKEKAPPQGDLSTIQNGDFNDNVISETLVNLLIHQGKKEKAIEVLKKLIWKFPQKKAYFAAQIEDLKK